MSQHASTRQLREYTAGDPTLAADEVWAIEVHLESCAQCRASLAGEATDVVPLVEQVWSQLEPDTMPAPTRRRWLVTWATPAMAPWLAMTIAVTVIAFVVDRLVDPSFPSFALLLAPVAPVAGVAAAWAKGLDPAHELVAATPKAGLYLVLRRTVAVLVVIIPLLAVATWTSPAQWLLPCLAFTVATLALGGFVGVRPAAVGLVSAWTLFVVGPSLVTATTPVVLEPAAFWAWVALFVVCTVVIRVRSTVYTRLDSR
jgi:hypothetical protein